MKLLINLSCFALLSFSLCTLACKENKGLEYKIEEGSKLEIPIASEQTSDLNQQMPQKKDSTISSTSESVVEEVESPPVVKEDVKIEAEIKPKPKAKKPIKKKKVAKIVFNESEYDFGEIEQGENVKYDFVFKNTGNRPLSISKATASCGCTQPSFPFLDIMPGEEGYIGVKYFSVGKEGLQEPEILVYSNDKVNPIVKLKMKGMVLLPEKKSETEKDTSKIDSSING